MSCREPSYTENQRADELLNLEALNVEFLLIRFVILPRGLFTYVEKKMFNRVPGSTTGSIREGTATGSLPVISC